MLPPKEVAPASVEFLLQPFPVKVSKERFVLWRGSAAEVESLAEEICSLGWTVCSPEVARKEEPFERATGYADIVD